MDVETTRSKMAKHLETARGSAMAGAMGWGFEIEDLTVFVRMSLRKDDNKSFLLRVVFDDFPRQAPVRGRPQTGSPIIPIDSSFLRAGSAP